METSKVLGKIKKCLALAKSGNEHEAAAAMRQAQKLMAEYNVGEQDVLASEVSEASAKAGAKSVPADWESFLADVVARAFGCTLLFTSGWTGGSWKFIGCGAAPEVAGYAFAVLLRQAKKARAEYAAKHLKRCKLATRIRRGDLFCDAWVRSVRRVVGDFAVGNAHQAEAVSAFLALHYRKLSDLKTRDRNAGGPKRDHEWRDLDAGAAAGRHVQLNHGVGGMSADAPALTDAR
ncbi:DUF2786 domain-containing protein [Chitinimonas viridis]|uniref:DUF2786 domain-containing protein n=1 Tax=Chitinimonas viridis TaxID=664880 RepID=A0ABT8B8X0_9NEIS|nr:DUF2786 domain-containing protein [Chitinimonas viridis]MDN3578687.1 DUF2786 domain-containing protein [Chitinimonas viridis]